MTVFLGDILIEIYTRENIICYFLNKLLFMNEEFYEFKVM